MKKSILLAVVFSFIAATTGFAQFDQGMMHGGVGVFAQPKLNSVQFTLRANGGYFIMDNLSVGLMPHFNRTVRNVNNDVGSVVSNVGLSLYGRYYFTFPFSDRFAVFPEVSLGPGSRGYKGNHSLGFNISAGAGANYFLTDNIAVEVVLPIVHSRNLKNNGVSDQLSVSPVIGIQYHF